MTDTTRSPIRRGMARCDAPGLWQIGIYSVEQQRDGRWRATATGPGTIGDGYISTYPTLADAYLMLTGEPMPGARTATPPVEPGPASPASGEEVLSGSFGDVPADVLAVEFGPADFAPVYNPAGTGGYDIVSRSTGEGPNGARHWFSSRHFADKACAIVNAGQPYPSMTDLCAPAPVMVPQVAQQQQARDGRADVEAGPSSIPMPPKALFRDNSRAISGPLLPSLDVTTPSGCYGIHCPPAMPVAEANVLFRQLAAAPELLATLRAIAGYPKQGEPCPDDPAYTQDWLDSGPEVPAAALEGIIDLARAAITDAAGPA